MLRSLIKGPALLLSTAVVAGMAGTAGGFPGFPPSCARADFKSGGVTVPAELCRGGRTATRLAVVLPGCGGTSGGFDHRLATELPRLGIDTLEVDYFARTPPPTRHGFCGVRRAFDKAFPAWLGTVADAVAHLRAAPAGTHLHIELVGWSLGGGVAVASALGSVHVSALAGFSTGSFGTTTADARKLPPTILLSGGSTDAIPLSETLPLYHALRAAHRPTALYIFPHGSHQWPGRQGMLGIDHAATFLRRY